MLLLVSVWPPAKAMPEPGPSRIATVNAAAIVTNCDDVMELCMIALPLMVSVGGHFASSRRGSRCFRQLGLDLNGSRLRKYAAAIYVQRS